MSAAISDAVAAHLEGTRLASRFLDSVSCATAHPEALSQAIVDLEGSSGVQRGFCRSIQKRLERSLA